MLIGGGDFTFTTGMLALTSKIPLIACSHYGGAASLVWDELSAGKGLAESRDVGQMNEPGSRDMADACVTSIRKQTKKKIEAMRPQRTIASLVSLGLLTIFAVLIMLGYCKIEGTDLSDELNWLLFLGPLAAGAGGAAIRSLYHNERFTMTGAALGAGAGLLCGYFYLISQVVSASTSKFQPTFIAFFFTLCFSFIGGFTANTVLGQVETIRALNTKKIAKNVSDSLDK